MRLTPARGPFIVPQNKSWKWDERENMANTDPFAAFKEAQKAGWAHFAPLETFTTPVAARLVKHARVRVGQRVLDVGCGTGVVAITAAREGAEVTGLDLTPALLERARENSRVAEVKVEWREGDAESLPFEDGAFDVVMSQFGHIFAPRPEVAIAEMLRVLKPGGTIAFATWPPELFTGKMFALTSSYSPPPPPGVSPPPQWGSPQIVTERLGSAVKNIVFDRGTMMVSALSVQHFRTAFERSAGPVIKLIESLAGDPAKLASFRKDCDALAGEYFADNIVRQDYLLTRATKI
jgi:SAM-dependent methyltransferase